jgi:hypothetical protein
MPVDEPEPVYRLEEEVLLPEVAITGGAESDELFQSPILMRSHAI